MGRRARLVTGIKMKDKMIVDVNRETIKQNEALPSQIG
jgi:hypothetical protein